MLELVNYGTFRELLRKCKQIDLELISIINMHDDCYECDECKVILSNDDVFVKILIAIHEEDEVGLPTAIQVLNVTMEPKL